MRRFVVLLFFAFPVFCIAQDFGFGFDDDESQSPAGASILPFTLNIAGEINAGQKFFFDDFTNNKTLERFSDLDFLTAKVNFSVPGKSVDTFIGLDLSYGSFAELRDLNRGHTPQILDEAWVRAYLGPVNVQAGFMKLTWGKMHSYGPLDVVNPLDYTDLSELQEPKNIKIARPMIHAAWAMGSLTKLEAVFVPWFQGDKFATTGRWAPSQITGLRAGIAETLTKTAGGILAIPDMLLPPAQKEPLLGTISQLGASLEKRFDDGGLYPDTYSLKYAQAGMRFTTTVRSSDLGLQYFFGRLSRPAISGFNPMMFFTPPALPAPPALADIHPDAIIPDVDYNYYHHIGADFARVIAGFNLRAEAGVNITGDTDGTDGTIENPSFVWALGFDRDLFAGINLNIQGTGKVRLFQSKLKGTFADCEAGNKATSTRITGIISRKFFREELELKTTGLWGIEDKDFLIMPAFIWSRNDMELELSSGFFGGDKDGELGQYRDNGFIRLMLSYKF